MGKAAWGRAKQMKLKEKRLEEVMPEGKALVAFECHPAPQGCHHTELEEGKQRPRAVWILVPLERDYCAEWDRRGLWDGDAVQQTVDRVELIWLYHPPFMSM